MLVHMHGVGVSTFEFISIGVSKKIAKGACVYFAHWHVHNIILEHRLELHPGLIVGNSQLTYVFVMDP